MSRKRQRQPDVVIPSRGVRIPLESGAGAAANLRAYTALDETSVLTHHSGGRIWELGLPPWLQEDWRIHVAREREGSRPRRQNVVGHRMTFKPGEVVMHDGAHHSDARQVRPDNKRRAVTERLCWTEVRVFKEDLEGERPFVIALVRAAVQSRHPAGDVQNGYRGKAHARTDT
ncbi:hypothetical protein NIBR502772_08555 [Pseudarthrobacter sp. NIBRBAC000502772]|uniref:hypothetical protein n=1 Tax=Pseudarthrobacter sp. NIBRBAC000502772 TaxID=2590775 RepID=UPI00113229F4|nr:hypothetical protein [Pseudarthrobacter sp. NIBRBAC000502772]QDG66253.1 hypothetical protein NIBR502772_08555 [Pseudarthrobacter sp. NIBRBAC000502772]